MIDTVVNQRYQVIERVGEGALFQVFKARDNTASRLVAAKFLRPEYGGDVALVQAVEMAGQAAALVHPSIARLVEVAQHDGMPCVIADYVRGIDLKERIRRIAPFTVSMAVDFAISICDALQAAHQGGVLHGDLRPNNVIVSPEGALKVTDFGFAQALAASPRAALANRPRAVHYQAPEYFEGGLLSPASDLYAVGCILFEMLTGGVPFPGDDPDVVQRKQLNAEPPSPRSLNSAVPRPVEALVLHALAKRPEDRYRAAADMLADLKAVRDSLRFGRPVGPLPFETTRPTGTPTQVPELQSPAPVPEPPSAVAPPAPARPPAPASPRPAPTAPPAGVEAPVPERPFMPRSRSRRDESVSPWLRLALGTVLVIILAAGIVGVALWMSVFRTPPSAKLPDLVGMRIEDARRAADKLTVKLVVREEFNDKAAPGIIFKSEYDPSGNAKAGHSYLVCVSKGSRTVWVPDLSRLSAQDADAKLKEAGLALGQVERKSSIDVPYGYVTAQDPRGPKKVDRGSAVNITVSDGPSADAGTTEPAPDTASGTTDASNGDAGADSTAHPYSVRITIPQDGKGSRRVRVEYDDAHGTNTAVDEQHHEGDVVPINVDVYGARITVRVYYGDNPLPVSERTVTLDRRQP